MILKPEEMVLFHSVKKGGLGLVSIRHKGMACLIRNFLELSIVDKYRHSLYSTALFKRYIENDSTIDISHPPYYNEDFFHTKISARNACFAIQCMTTKDWYKYLLTRDFAEEESESGLLTNFPCKAETACPDADLDRIWSWV